MRFFWIAIYLILYTFCNVTYSQMINQSIKNNTTINDLTSQIRVIKQEKNDNKNK
jgi:hypothetical protein